MRVALLALLLPLCLAQEGLGSGSLGALLAASSEVPYNPALAKLLVYYSAASYCSNRSALASWTCPRCSPPSSNAPPLRHVQVLWNSSSQVQGYVAYDAASNLTVIAFRGSVGTLNWLEDFDVTLVPRPDACASCQRNEIKLDYVRCSCRYWINNWFEILHIFVIYLIKFCPRERPNRQQCRLYLCAWPKTALSSHHYLSY